MEQFRLLLVVVLLMLFVFSVTSSAKDWRGVVPTRSSREDVVRLLNQCRDPEQDCEFELGNEQVHIVFSEDHTGRIQCARELPANKVLLIEVRLKTPSRLKHYKVPLKNLRTFDSSSPPGQGYKGYIDDKEGVILNTYHGRIIQIDYLASLKDRYFCQAYYENPESFIHVRLFRHCPSLAIRCPQSAAHAGDKITVSTETVENSSQIIWTVTAGKIVSGQGTPSIVVDTTGVGAQVFTVTLTLYGYCQTSCSLEILPK